MTRSSTSPDDPRAQALAGLSRVAAVLREQARRAPGGARLSPAQRQIVGLLAARPNGVPLKAVAETLQVRPASASEAVTALARRGLVAKSPDAADRRSLALTLTTAGRAAATDAETWPDAVLGAFDTLDGGDVAALLRALTKIIRGLQENAAAPLARMCPDCRHFRPNAHADPERPHHCAFVDAAFGDAGLRLDCPDHDEISAGRRGPTWRRFLGRDPNAPPTETGATSA